MKRILWALPLAVACVLFAVPAWAAESAIAILPVVAQTHWLLSLMVVVIPAIRTGLSNDTVKLPTAAAPWRAAIVAILAGSTTLLDQLSNGFDFKTAIVAFLMLGLPSIVQEILKVVFGASNGTGGSANSIAPASPTGMPSMWPPPPLGKGARMVGASLAFCALVFAGCAAKPFVCPILKIADSLCQSVVIQLPDGSEERVPMDAIRGVVLGARAARMAGAATAGPGDAGIADAGADR